MARNHTCRHPFAPLLSQGNVASAVQVDLARRVSRTAPEGFVDANSNPSIDGLRRRAYDSQVVGGFRSRFEDGR